MLTLIEMLQLLVIWSAWEILVRRHILFSQLKAFYRKAAIEGTQEHEILESTYKILTDTAKTIIGAHIMHKLNGWMGREQRNANSILDEIDGEISGETVQNTLDGGTVLLTKAKEKSKTADSILTLIEGMKAVGPMLGNQGHVNHGGGGRIR